MKNKELVSTILLLIMISMVYSVIPITAQPDDFVFVHLTDTHIGNPNSATQLQSAITEINSMNPLPDFAVITGDLTAEGNLEQYTTLKNLIDQFNVPVYLIRGNHDVDRDPDAAYFRTFFGDPYYSFDHSSHHLVMLDSSNPYPGHFSTEQLSWLSQDLAIVGPDTPILLFVHHMVVGMEWTVNWPLGGIDNGQELLNMIEGYNVRKIFTGHAHANIEVNYNGISQVTTCSVWNNYNDLTLGGPVGYRIVHISNGQVTSDFKILGGGLVHRSNERLVADVDFYTNGAGSSAVIDGVLSSGEWDDAWKITRISPSGYEWNAYLKQNLKNLYVALNLSDASFHEADCVLIQIDGNNDGVWDYISSIYRNGTVFDFPLDYTRGIPFAILVVTDASNGYIIEFCVLLSNIGNPGEGEAIRMALTTQDGNTHVNDVWPDNAGQDPEFGARMVSSNGWSANSLVGLWHFDEGSGTVVADSSGNGNSGTVNGAVWVDGEFGKALSFDGVDDYVVVPGTDVLRILADATVEAWIKPSSVSGLTVVVAQGALGDIEETNWLYSVLISDGRVGYYHEYGGKNQVWVMTDNPVVSVGECYRICVVRLATVKEIKIYLNETLVKSGSYTESPTGGSSTYLYVGGMDSKYSFNGIIDEVYVWNEARALDTLVGLWHFDEGSGTTAYDSSGYGNDGSISGAVWIDGKFGKALDFDGVDDMVNVGHDASLNTNENMTLEAWVKRGSIGTKHVIIGRRTDVTSWTYFIRFNADNTITFAISKTGDDTGYTALTTINAYTDTTNWHHVAATYRYVADGTSVMRIYYDGSLAAETTSAVGPIVSDTVRDVWIGAREQPGDNQWFDGAIDEVQIWSQERTAEQILQDSMPEPLVGFWRFDEGVGTIAFDSSEYHNNGNISGAIRVLGRYGKALHFDGVDDRVIVKTSASLNTRYGLTLEAWVKRDSIGTLQVIVGKRTSASSWTYFLRFHGDNTLFFAVSKTGDDTGYTALVTADVYTDTTSWHHVAATYQYITDGTSIMRIYYDGLLAAETNTAVGPIVSDTVRDVWIGAREQPGSEQWFNGSIDEVKIWSEARVPPPSPLVGFWRFDEGTGATAYDSSEYGNNGVLLPPTKGAFGGALDFDGVDDKVSVAASASLNTRYGLTLEAWVKRDAIGANHVIIGRRTASTSWTYFIRFNADNTITFAISKTGDDTGYTALTTINAYTDTTNWHHVAATYRYVADGTSVMRIYYDGSLAAETTSAVGPIVSDTVREVWIGARGQAGSEQWFNGAIDEVRVSNIARTSFDLTVAPSVDADTVALWHFNEETGTIANDETAYNNDGTITGATWLLAGPTWTTVGKYNGALKFDGVNDYVQVPDSNSLDIASKITLEAWIYPYTVGKDYQVIVHKHHHTDNNRSYYLGLQTNKLVFYLSRDGVTNYILTSATSIAANVWTHVAATSDGTTMKLFINGVQDPNTLAAPTTIYPNSYPLIIGAYLPDVSGYQRHFNGIIDEVAVFNVVRSVHNIAVTSITSWKTVVGEGINQTIRIYAVVENQGEYSETFNVNLYYDSNPIETQTISNLASKDFTTLTFTFNTTDLTKSSYAISAIADAVQGEIYTTDNTHTDGTITVSILCDIAGSTTIPPAPPNGKVDYKDVFWFLKAYGSDPTKPNWDPNCDVAGSTNTPPAPPDDKVDYKDIFWLLKNYGKTDP